MTLKQKYYQRVYKQGNQWKISVQHCGVRKTFYSSVPGEAGRRDCANKVIAWLEDENVSSISERTTVDKIYQQYLKDKALETTDIYTIENRYKNHIKPVIGSIRVLYLTVQDMKRVIMTAYKNFNLSKKTLKNLRGDLSSFCAYLDDANIRHDLSTARIKIPAGATPSHKRSMTAKDIYTLFTCNKTIYNGQVVEDYYINAYRFHLLYGLRPGELIGLEWGDFLSDSFTVQRSVNAKGQVTKGKNDFVYRTLPLTPMAKQLLKNQEKYRVSFHDKTERVFGDFGQLCYRKRWGLFCEHNGIPYITPYEIRHTFASVNKFLPEWILDVVMGHAHEGMSLGVYAHALDGDMDNVASLLDKNLTEQIERGKIAPAA